MQYATLTRAGLTVSRIGVGCEQLGGTDWGTYDVGETVQAVRHAAERGINVFDTANVYGLGRSEELLADALGEGRRDAVIVTKGGVCWEPPPAGKRARTWIDLSRRALRSAVEGSLARLRIDAIPLYLLHWPDPRVPLEESLETLVQLRSEGKIRSFGLSNFSIADVKRADALAPIAAVEFRYNLLEHRGAEEYFSYCGERGIGVFVYGPLAEGLLAGKYAQQAAFTPEDRRSRLPHFQGEALKQHLDLVERVKETAARHGTTPAQVALRWVLSNNGIASTVVGMKNDRHLEDALASLGWEMKEEEARELAMHAQRRSSAKEA